VSRQYLEDILYDLPRDVSLTLIKISGGLWEASILGTDIKVTSTKLEIVAERAIWWYKEIQTGELTEITRND